MLARGGVLLCTTAWSGGFHLLSLCILSTHGAMENAALIFVTTFLAARMPYRHCHAAHCDTYV